MIQATLEIQTHPLHTIRALLRALFDQGLADAFLVPMPLAGGSLAPTLVTNPAALIHADPLTPLLPINAARAASQLTITGHHHQLALVLRPCEIRALVELVKFQQVKLDNTLIIGLDCLGTFKTSDYLALPDPQPAFDHLLAAAATGNLSPPQGLNFRSACLICEQPLPDGEHVALAIGLLGSDPGTLALTARDDIAQALNLTPANPPPGRAAATQRLVTTRTQSRDAAFTELRQRVHSMDGLLQEFSTCIRCHNCMVNCPICYCRECIFRTPTFEHESQLLFQWAERKGTVRLLPDTLLFHLTRLNHMVTSCVGCGLCTDACPADIPVGTIFRAVGEKVQAIFDYHPGRSLDEAAPVQEFREDELASLGERPHA